MANFLEVNLKKLAFIQRKHAKKIVIISIIITIILGAGLKDLKLNSDIRQEMPLEIPIFKLNDRISDKFGGKDTVIITAQLDDSVELKDAVHDIRDPFVINSFMFIEKVLQDEPSVESISSPASFFRGKLITQEEIQKTFNEKPEINMFFSHDYKTALMYVSADMGSGEENIQKFNKLINIRIEQIPTPLGVKFSITGQPILRMTIFELLRRDAVVTLVTAAIIILLLLLAMQRSYTMALLVFVPLTLGLIWTMGTLGWLGIPLSVATVSLSTMILGLGVEYGIFVVSRYKEEREKHSQIDSLQTTVYGIGSAIIGSGLTTIVGFGVLSFATMPMIQKLGQTLALGIAFCLIAALFVNPVLIILEEEYEIWNTKRKLANLTEKRNRHLEMK